MHNAGMQTSQSIITRDIHNVNNKINSFIEWVHSVRNRAFHLSIH